MFIFANLKERVIITMHKTIIEYLHHQVAIKPNEVAYTFSPTKVYPHTKLTYKKLWFEAQSVANFLKSKTEVGDKVLLLYTPNIDYVIAFYGCLLAGVIAVPAPLPKVNSHQTIEIIKNSQPLLVLTTLREVSAIKNFWQEQGDSLKPINIFTSENSVSLYGDLGPVVKINPKLPAFLDYYYDNKNIYKEVMVSHSDIIENVQLMPLISDEKENGIFVDWLPFFNDMDLIVMCS
jgi:acyl-CoA synthetase (AMP-forming)/AMP-acid ligase II